MGNIVLQDIVLNQLRRDKIKTKLVVASGQQIDGTVKGFDNYTIILDLDDGGQIMVYKHNLISVYSPFQILTSKAEKI